MASIASSRIAVVGIEVGNESAHVALARGAKVQVLQNPLGSRKTASTVGFTARNRVWGAAATAQERSNAANTMSDYMQLIGLTTDDPEYKEMTKGLPYPLQAASANLNLGQRQRVVCPITLAGQKHEVLPEVALAYLLQNFKSMVEAETKGQNVEDVVIAVPGYWTDRERCSLQTALTLAGWTPLRIMNETCALALYYGLRAPLPTDPIKVAFLDSGRTHTSVAVVEFKEGKESSLRVVATAHDRTLGGRAFDNLVCAHLVEDIKTRYKLDVASDPRAFQKVLREASRVKVTLSANSDVRWAVESVMNDVDVKGTFDRVTFDRLAQPLYARASQLVHRVLEASGLAAGLAAVKSGGPNPLHSIEIVGGCSRIPGLKEAVQSSLGMSLSATCDSDEGVVRGATLECANLSSSTRLAKVLKAVDICNYPVEVVYYNDGVEKTLRVFKAGDKLPCLVKFPLRRDAPFEIKLRYDRAATLAPGYAGLPLSPALDDYIGTFRVSGTFEEYLKEFPQDTTPKVNLFVRLDKNGLAFVDEAELELRYVKESHAEEAKAAGDSAAKLDSKDEKKDKVKIKTKPLTVSAEFTTGFTSTQVDFLKAQLAAMAAVDADAGRLDELKNELESFTLRGKSELHGTLQPFLSPAAADALSAAFDAAEIWLEEESYDASPQDFRDRLGCVRAAADGAFERRAAFTSVAEALDELDALLSGYSAVENAPKYAHLSDDDKKAVLDEVKAGQVWAQEARLKLTNKLELPRVSADQVQSRAEQSKKVCSPIVGKKATAEEQKAAEAKAAEARSDASSDAPAALALE